MYTIGQVSKMFNLPISTLRYYDKEGLFIDIPRISGMRKYGEKEIETIRVIECLKKSGLEIKDIKKFMVWCHDGKETFELRKELFVSRKKIVEEEIKRLEKTMAMIDFKCWYYTEAIKYGGEERVIKMIPNDLPEEIKKIYKASHEE